MKLNKDECMKGKWWKLGINIGIQDFQLISHLALGLVPTEVREMLRASLTRSLEWKITIWEGKLVIVARWWIFTCFSHFFLPTHI